MNHVQRSGTGTSHPVRSKVKVDDTLNAETVFRPRTSAKGRGEMGRWRVRGWAENEPEESRKDVSINTGTCVAQTSTSNGRKRSCEFLVRWTLLKRFLSNMQGGN